MANKKWLIDAENLMELARNHTDGTVDCNDIARVPKIDAEIVVRCNKCRFHSLSTQNLWCDIFDKIMPTDGFCSYGERRD